MSHHKLGGFSRPKRKFKKYAVLFIKKGRKEDLEFFFPGSVGVISNQIKSKSIANKDFGNRFQVNNKGSCDLLIFIFYCLHLNKCNKNFVGSTFI